MCPVTQAKKQGAPAQKQQLTSSLQPRGMSMDSLMGREEIKSLVGDAGKPAADKTQAFARSSAKAFFSRHGAIKGSAKPGAPKASAPDKPKKF
jgi:hypothetical protein